MFKLQSYHGYKQRLVLNFTTFYKDIISKLFTEVGDNSNRIPHSVSIMICRHVKMHLGIIHKWCPTIFEHPSPLMSDFYFQMSDFFGLFQTPYLPLKSYIINGRSLTKYQ